MWIAHGSSCKGGFLTVSQETNDLGASGKMARVMFITSPSGDKPNMSTTDSGSSLRLASARTQYCSVFMCGEHDGLPCARFGKRRWLARL